MQLQTYIIAILVDSTMAPGFNCGMLICNRAVTTVSVALCHQELTCLILVLNRLVIHTCLIEILFLHGKYALDALLMLTVLQKAVECLHGIEQSPGSSVMEAIQPSLKAVTREELLKHEDDNVKVLLATCFCEITRITAPDAPYNDDILRVTSKSFKSPYDWFI